MMHPEALYVPTLLIGMGAGAVITLWVIWFIFERGKHD